jgi:hypothetical protein
LAVRVPVIEPWERDSYKNIIVGSCKALGYNYYYAKPYVWFLKAINRYPKHALGADIESVCDVLATWPENVVVRLIAEVLLYSSTPEQWGALMLIGRLRHPGFVLPLLVCGMADVSLANRITARQHLVKIYPKHTEAIIFGALLNLNLLRAAFADSNLDEVNRVLRRLARLCRELSRETQRQGT